jgi:hypothetical protein
MKFKTKIQGDDKYREVLKQARELAQGKAGVLKPALKAIGLQMLAWVEQNIKQEGKLAQPGGWHKLSPVTVLLRRRGRARKIRDWDDIASTRGRMKILRDTGVMAASLRAKPENILKVDNLKVVVGSKEKKAAKHQRGFTALFRFDETAQERFRKNVVEAFGGRPSRTPTGRKSRAKKRWNPAYFQMFNWLKKLSGKSFEVPARPLVWPPRPREEQQLFMILENFVAKKTAEMNK